MNLADAALILGLWVVKQKDGIPGLYDRVDGTEPDYEDWIAIGEALQTLRELGVE